MKLLSLTALLLIVSGNVLAKTGDFEVIHAPQVQGYFIAPRSSPEGVCLALGFNQGYMEHSFAANFDFYASNETAREVKTPNTVEINKLGRIIRIYGKEDYYVASIACWK